MWTPLSTVMFITIIASSFPEMIHYEPVLSECPDETEVTPINRGDDVFQYNPSAMGSFPDLKRDVGMRVAAPDERMGFSTEVSRHRLHENEILQKLFRAITQNLSDLTEEKDNRFTALRGNNSEHKVNNRFRRRAQLFKPHLKQSEMGPPVFPEITSETGHSNDSRVPQNKVSQLGFAISKEEEDLTFAFASPESQDKGLFENMEVTAKVKDGQHMESMQRSTAKTRAHTQLQLRRLMLVLDVLKVLHQRVRSMPDSAADRRELSSEQPKDYLVQRSGERASKRAHSLHLSATMDLIRHVLGRMLKWDTKVHKRVSFVHPSMLIGELGFLQSTRNIDSDILERVKEITDNIYDLVNDDPPVLKRLAEKTFNWLLDNREDAEGTRSSGEQIYPGSKEVKTGHPGHSVHDDIHTSSTAALSAILQSKRGQYPKQNRKHRDGSFARNLTTDSRLPWMCPSTTRWRDLGIHVFPRYVQETLCGNGNNNSSTCWYGNYHCRPSTLSVQVLIRHTGTCNDSRVPVIMRRHYFLSVLRINTSCNCGR